MRDASWVPWAACPPLSYAGRLPARESQTATLRVLCDFLLDLVADGGWVTGWSRTGHAGLA